VELRKHYVAALSYHTAYVMAFLCAAILRSKTPPQVARTRTDALVALPFSLELLGLLLGDKRRPQWLQTVERMPEDDLPTYPSFLLDVALRRAIRDFKFDRVHRLLERAVASRVSSSPLCAQAAAVLNRLAACQNVLCC
jgi:hypothetical protein